VLVRVAQEGGKRVGGQGRVAGGDVSGFGVGRAQKQGARFGRGMLQTSDGHTALILALRDYTATTVTYNLTIDTLHTYYVEAGDTPVLVHNAGGSTLNDTIGLGDGYTGRLDQFDYGQGTDFEIHVYSRGTEVGIFGSDGFFAKHGLSADVSVPDGVYNRLKGKAIEFMCNTGRIGPQGTQDITGDKWKMPRLGGGC
jgi:hypothetical protein